MIGSNVTIGHNCTLRSCSIADASLVGMDSTILEGVQVSADLLIATGVAVLAAVYTVVGSQCTA